MNDSEQCRADEAGFTIIELLIALAIFVLVSFTVLQSLILGTRVLTSTHAATATQGELSVNQFSSRLRAEAQAAFAIDLNNGSSARRSLLNLNDPNAPEVVFYGKDDQGNAAYWGYRQDSLVHTVYRDDFGTSLQNQPTSTAIPELSALSVARIDADQLGTYSNGDYAGAFKSLRPATCYDVPVETPAIAQRNPGSAPCGKAFAAGNHVIALTLRSGHAERTIHLVAGALPSSFHIHVKPTYHVVVWREDHPNHSFPFIQKSTAFVLGNVSISYTDGRTWLPWCTRLFIHHVVVGHGLFEKGDVDAEFHENDPEEKASRLIDRCRQSGPPVPAADAASAAQYTPPPDTFEPPEPGVSVPPNFTPPPGVSSPPPDSCAAYPSAPVCPKPIVDRTPTVK